MIAGETKPTMRGELRSFRNPTPWDISDWVTDYGLGIKFYSTPSHGGFYVPNEMLHRIPKEGRAYGKRWSQSENWYEEDCAWAYVALAFPELFTAGELESANKVMEWIKRDQ